MTGTKRIKIKVCLLGDPAVGKTSLVYQFVSNFFSDSYVRTMGTKVSRKIVQIHEPTSDTDYEVIMMLWDIMGQQFSSIPLDNYFKMSQGALLVCDITRNDTFKNLLAWKDALEKGSGDVPIIYLANKIDLEKDLDFSLHDFQEFCQKENRDYFFTSAKTGENVNAAFQRLGELIIRSEISSSEKGIKAETSPKFEQIEELIQRTLKHPQLQKGTMRLAGASASGPTAAQLDESSIKININDIKRGLGYIIKEEKPNQSFLIFKKLINEGAKGLCITRMHPKRIIDEYNIKDAPIYWLSSEVHKYKNIVAPTFLPQLNTIIIDFIQKNDNGVIILEGIEYLIEQNDFNTVLNLMHSVNDNIMGSNTRLIIPIDPLILNEREMHMLTRDMKIFNL